MDASNFPFAFIGGDAKKVVVLDGADQKVDDPSPNPQTILVKLPLFVGGHFFLLRIA